MAVVASAVGAVAVRSAVAVGGRSFATRLPAAIVCRRPITMTTSAIVDRRVKPSRQAIEKPPSTMTTKSKVRTAADVKSSIARCLDVEVSLGSVGVASEIGRRMENEDRTVVRRLAADLLLVGIFDGHGGNEAVDFVSSRLIEVVTYWLERTGNNMQSTLRNAFIDINNRLTEEMEQPTTDQGRVRISKSSSCGTTATVCLLKGNSELVIGHVGDSRAILCRRDAGLVLTTDHSPDDPDELERIFQCSGHVMQTSVGRPRVNGILEMTRSLGDIRLKQYGVTAEPEIVSVELDSSTDKCLVLTTDGVHNTLNTGDIVDSVSSSLDATEAASSVTEQAMFCGSSDNCTTLVLPLAAWDSNIKARIVKFPSGHHFGNCF